MNRGLSKSDIIKVQEAASLLINHLNKHIPISDLSIMVNLNENKLKKGFMELYGSSARTYLSNLRLEKAVELLLQDLPLKRIALEIGYKDKSNLIKAFQMKYGVTPAKWKKQYEIGLTINPYSFTTYQRQTILKNK